MSGDGPSEVMAEVPRNDPMRIAWEEYKQTEEFANTRKWAVHEEHVDGSLWTAFCAGYQAALDLR